MSDLLNLFFFFCFSYIRTILVEDTDKIMSKQNKNTERRSSPPLPEVITVEFVNIEPIVFPFRNETETNNIAIIRDCK